MLIYDTDHTASRVAGGVKPGGEARLTMHRAPPLPPPAFPADAEPERITGWPLVAVWLVALVGSWALAIGAGWIVWRAGHTVVLWLSWLIGA